MSTCYLHYFQRLSSQPFLLQPNALITFKFVGREQLSVYDKAKVKVSKEVSTLVGSGFVEHFGRKDSGSKFEFNRKREWMLLWISAICCGWDLGEVAATHVSFLASSMCKHLSLLMYSATSLKLEGSKEAGDRAGKDVKCVGTGKQCAGHLEIIHPWYRTEMGETGTLQWSLLSSSSLHPVPVSMPGYLPRMARWWNAALYGGVMRTIKDHISFPDCGKGN